MADTTSYHVPPLSVEGRGQPHTKDVKVKPPITEKYDATVPPLSVRPPASPCQRRALQACETRGETARQSLWTMVGSGTPPCSLDACYERYTMSFTPHEIEGSSFGYQCGHRSQDGPAPRTAARPKWDHREAPATARACCNRRSDTRTMAGMAPRNTPIRTPARFTGGELCVCKFPDPLYCLPACELPAAGGPKFHLSAVQLLLGLFGCPGWT
ncbi:hypothetical protein VDGL01_05145 [Verticillium dahliae]